MLNLISDNDETPTVEKKDGQKKNAENSKKNESEEKTSVTR